MMSETNIDLSNEKSTEKSTEKSSRMSTEKSTENPTENSTEKSTGKSTETAPPPFETLKIHSNSDFKKPTKQFHYGEIPSEDDSENPCPFSINNDNNNNNNNNHYYQNYFRRHGVPFNSFSMDPGDWLEFYNNFTWDLSPFYGPYGMHLSVSVMLNGALCFLFLLMLLPDDRTYHHFNLNKSRDWTVNSVSLVKKAYNEKCSGRGDFWADTQISVDGNRRCECHPCFKGPDCLEVVTDCVINAKNGDALLFEHYWKVNRALSSVLIPSHYRIGYGENSVDDIHVSRNFEMSIRKIHEKIGNAKVTDKYLVIGEGFTQIINSVLFAFGHVHSGGAKGVPLIVTSKGPYSPEFEESSHFFDSRFFAWGGQENGWLVKKAPKTLELVTSPNNPDGKMRKANLTGPNAFSIYDHTYYWPHFTPIREEMDNDVMIFSLSKLTGHAGSRIGWAFVRDKVIADNMNNAIKKLTFGVSHESQLRATQLINSILDKVSENKIPPPCTNNMAPFINKVQFFRSKNKIVAEQLAENGLFFPHVASVMSARWEKLESVFGNATYTETQKRFSLQNRETGVCTYFNTTRTATPAYAWIKCNHDSDCYQVFKSMGIEGSSGTLYSVGKEYVRLSLLMRESTFEFLLKHLTSNLKP